MASLASPPKTETRRHAAFVRITHWLTFVAFMALLITGTEIVVSHPRFYWGETGNVNMHPLFTIHIPSSRDTVPTGYGYVMPDQNGWSRYLHFESAWLLVITGVVYLVAGLATGHFRRILLGRIDDGSGAPSDAPLPSICAARPPIQPALSAITPCRRRLIWQSCLSFSRWSSGPGSHSLPPSTRHFPSS